MRGGGWRGLEGVVEVSGQVALRQSVTQALHRICHRSFSSERPASRDKQQGIEGDPRLARPMHTKLVGKVVPCLSASTMPIGPCRAGPTAPSSQGSEAQSLVCRFPPRHPLMRSWQRGGGEGWDGGQQADGRR